jgi:hypothetical protein
MMVYSEIILKFWTISIISGRKEWICLCLYKEQEKGRTYSDRPVRKQPVSIPLSPFHMKIEAHKASKRVRFLLPEITDKAQNFSHKYGKD